MTERTVTASGSLALTDELIIFNSASAIEFALTPTQGANRLIYLTNKGAGAVKIYGYGSDLINFDTNKTLYQGDSIQLVDASMGYYVGIAIGNEVHESLGVPCVKTIKKTIGGVGVAGCDFNFATAANTTEQIIDLGAIIPAKARILDAMTFTNSVFTGATTLVAETGVTSSGAELIASASIYAANAITALTHALGFNTAPSASSAHVYVSATPGANWSNVTAGKVSVYITYIDITNL